MVEGSIRVRWEWASEGEQKRVCEPERILRYQIQHMIVCDEWVCEYQAGWHRRSFTLVPASDCYCGRQGYFFAV